MKEWIDDHLYEIGTIAVAIAVVAALARIFCVVMATMAELGVL